MDHDPLRDKLHAQDWAVLFKRLTDFATHRTKSKEQGKELAQAAITSVFAYDSKWDPEREPNLLRYLMSVVNSLLANERTSARTRRDVPLEDEGDEPAAYADPRAFSEDTMSDVDIFDRRLALLKARLADDPPAMRVLELTLAFVDAPADIAKATGWSPKEVDAARLRMHRKAAQVAREVGRERAPGAEDEEVA